MLKHFPLLALLLLPACASNEPSHLPRIWELPGAVIGGGIENATYKARRRRVKTHVAANIDTILADMRAGTGPALIRGYELAGIKPDKQSELIRNVLEYPDIYLEGPQEQRIENLTVAFMVHGN